ncbi:hypothetical protein ACFL2Q_18055, partial [Thermodesulfobacteriota bacterium]
KVTGSQLEEIKQVSHDRESHYFSSMDERRQWWVEAGFSEVSFIWQYYCVAILVGQKAAEHDEKHRHDLNNQQAAGKRESSGLSRANRGFIKEGS